MAAARKLKYNLAEKQAEKHYYLLCRAFHVGRQMTVKMYAVTQEINGFYSFAIMVST